MLEHCFLRGALQSFIVEKLSSELDELKNISSQLQHRRY